MQAPHNCGLCDGPIAFIRVENGYRTWRCLPCGWWHTSKDCCDPVSTVESGPVFAAHTYPADSAAARWVISLPSKGDRVFNPGTGDVEKWDGTRSEWRWVRFADGDLMLGCYPQADSYSTLESVVDEDFERAEGNDTLRIIQVTGGDDA